MTADEQAYAELCVGCIQEKWCHEDDTKLCDAYLMRVEELEGNNGTD